MCGVKLAQEHGDSVLICSLDAVMVLSSSSSPMKKEDEAEQQQAAASQAQQSSLPSVFQYNRRAGSGVELPGIDTSWPTDESTSTGMLSLHHEEKIGAVLAVKDLLHRKEQLVTALATLNSRVVLEREASGLGAYNENVTNADVSIDTSSWSAAGDRSILQRQYAWIVVNLDVTNRSLQEALVRLQECSGNAQVQSLIHAFSHADSVLDNVVCVCVADIATSCLCTRLLLVSELRVRCRHPLCRSPLLLLSLSPWTWTQPRALPNR